MTEQPNNKTLDLIAKQLYGKNMGLADPRERQLDDIAQSIRNVSPERLAFGKEDHIANYEQLTMTERKVMDVLPGVADSAVVKRLGEFGESNFGKKV